MRDNGLCSLQGTTEIDVDAGVKVLQGNILYGRGVDETHIVEQPIKLVLSGQFIKKCYTSGFATEINSVESAGKIVRLGAGKTDNLMTLVGQHFCCGKADPLLAPVIRMFIFDGELFYSVNVHFFNSSPVLPPCLRRSVANADSSSLTSSGVS